MRFLFIVALSLVVSTAARSQDLAAEPAPDKPELDRWDAVLALPAVARVEIKNRAGAFLEGTVRSVDDERIVIEAKTSTVDVARSAVDRIVLIGARKTARFARRGFLAGAALGAAVAVIGRAPAYVIAHLSAGWGVLGSGIGEVEGLQSRERVVIYQAVP